MELTPKEEKKLEKYLNFVEDKELSTIQEFDNLEEKINEVSQKVDVIAQRTEDSIKTISEELKKKLESELVLEINKEELRGEKGDSYVLTENDKKDIASKINVPIVEKVIEKTTEIVKEPTVTEVVREVAVADTPPKIVDKLESLKGDDRLDISAIKGVEKNNSTLSDELTNRAIGIVDNRTSFLINKVNTLQTTVNSTITRTALAPYTIFTYTV